MFEVADFADALAEFYAARNQRGNEPPEETEARFWEAVKELNTAFKNAVKALF